MGQSVDLAGLYATLEGPLKGYLGRLGVPRDRRDDLYHEVWLLISERLSSLTGGGEGIRKWAYVVARYVWLNDRRSRGVERVDFMPDTLPPPVVACNPDPEVRIRALELFGALTAEEQDLLLLRGVRGLGNPEIAEHYGCSVTAIETRIYRLRKRISEIL